LRQDSTTSMVDSVRVPWVPLYRFPTLALRAFAMPVACPHSDSYAPSDCLEGLGAFGAGLPCLLAPRLPIPCRLSRVHHGGLQQDSVGGTCLVAPATLCGSPVPAEGTQVDLGHLLQTRSCILHRSLLPQHAAASLPGSHSREGRRGAAFPVGRSVLQVLHHPLSPPNATSWRLPFSAWHLLGACCSHPRVV
jgi:hypothetical protein